MGSVALRVQGLTVEDQVLVLARLAQERTPSGRFAPSLLDELFDGVGLPRPAKVANTLGRLEKKGLVARQKNVRASWRLTPEGRARSVDVIDEMGMAALVAETAIDIAPTFGHVMHPLVPPWLAPPEVLPALHDFLADHPFDSNVFGMTRFPDEQDASARDPVANALEEARGACASHGLELHLASDRKLLDDLWANVAAHMWACRYGIGVFEDRRSSGVNYNLTIEVGGMLTTGRRVALLKDSSISSLPTDLVGKIYTSVDLEKAGVVHDAIHVWLRDDLRLGACDRCPPTSS